MTLIPTTDLYFLNACKQSVGRWFQRGVVHRLGDNCFAAGDAVLLIRRDKEKLMRTLHALPVGRFLYLVDDDIEAAKEASLLPQDYRDRLVRFHDEHHAALVARADTLIVSSPELKKKFVWHPDVRLLHPVWHRPPADDRHFNTLGHSGLVRAVHLGSGSHAAELDFLAPVVEALLTRHDRFEFTYFGKRSALGGLDHHPRVHRINPKPWPRYRRWIINQRFHLGLYPLPISAFNRSRSRNKLLEHGVVGAVGVYPRDWPTAQSITGQAILTGEKEDDWIEALSPLIAEPERLRTLMLEARPLLAGMNDFVAQRRFWSDLMGVTL